jgi:hypothetical protein
MRHVRVKVKRDTQTTNNRTCLPWEVAILGYIFEEEAIEETGEFVTVPGEYPDAAAEYARLQTAYGSDPQSGVPHVASVYGGARAGVRSLAKAIQAAQEDEEATKPKRGRKPAPRLELDPLLS